MRTAHTRTLGRGGLEMITLLRAAIEREHRGRMLLPDRIEIHGGRYPDFLEAATNR